MSKRAVAPTPGDAFKRSRMWLGDPSTGRPDVDEEAQELRDAAWQRDEARKTVELENRAARKAAKEGKRFVTSGDARRMWLALDPHGSKR